MNKEISNIMSENPMTVGTIGITLSGLTASINYAAMSINFNTLSFLITTISTLIGLGISIFTLYSMVLNREKTRLEIENEKIDLALKKKQLEQLEQSEKDEIE